MRLEPNCGDYKVNEIGFAPITSGIMRNTDLPRSTAGILTYHMALFIG